MSNNYVAHIPSNINIFHYNLSEIQDTILKQAMEALYEIRESHPETTVTNIKSVYTTPYHSHRMNDKLLPLCQYVANVVTSTYNNLYNVDLNGLNLEYRVVDCWCAIYEPGDFTVRHNHYPADYSCCVYLDADETSAPIIFEDKYPLQPAKNSLVIFPGNLYHEVPPTQGRRIIVAFNLYKHATFT